MKKYRDLDLATRLRIYNHAMELRRQGLGCKRVTKIIQEIHGVSISPRNVNDWFNHRKTPLRGAAKEILCGSTALKPINQLTKYEELNLEERLKLHEEALKLHFMGYGARSIATVLRLKYSVEVGVGAIVGWIRGYLPRGRIKTNLTPSPQLATIVANSISDGTVSEGTRPRFATQMKDLEPIELVRECLKEIAGRDYQRSYLPSRNVYFTSAYRKDLLEYLKNINVLDLLQKYPKDFIKMFFEAEGGPSATVIRKEKGSKMTGFFNAIVFAVNSSQELLKAIQEGLKITYKIQSHIRLVTKAGTLREIHGKKVVSKKDCYRLEICSKNSIIRYAEIGFISKRRQEKLDDIIDILKTYGKTEEGAIEWVRRYKYCEEGREKWIRRQTLLSHEEAISELSRLLRERQKNKQATTDHNHYH